MLPKGDAETADFINTDIRSDRSLAGEDLTVEVEGGIATLSGEADSLAQVERATARAVAMVGIRAVVNHVEIQLRKSADILKEAKDMLAKQQVIPSGEIQVSVSGQRLSLSGNVAFSDQKDLASELVHTVRGVAAVDNERTVTGKGNRNDEPLSKELNFLISRDPLFDGLHIEVSVHAGSVRISGQVGSRGDISRLIRLCRVEGVTAFRTTGLRVNKDLALEGLTDKDYSKRESLDAFKAALLHDHLIDPTSVRVVMNDGVMILNGKVPSVVQSDALAFMARGIPGVRSVVNLLEISGTEQLAGSPATFPARIPVLSSRR
jgi:osmotically-inducible protein OsmY